MPTFEFNKLVRDGLKEMYVDLGQEATYQDITPDEHVQLLVQKEAEEFGELEMVAAENKPSEAADCLQILEDYVALGEQDKADALRERLSEYMTEHNIDSADVRILQQQKYAKKGGFADGTYVLKLALRDDDKWVEYYRREPERFRELS